MKRAVFTLLALTLASLPAPRGSAQFGLTPIKRPNIANVFHPVVGAGAVYDQTDKEGRKSKIEMSIVEREMVGTQQGYWFEFGNTAENSAETRYGKGLVTPDDFVFHKIVFLMPGSAQPMMMEMNGDSHREIEKDLEKWHSIGTETITVPAGTFSCEHWKRDDGNGEAWVSAKVSPMSLVKSLDNGNTMILVKVISAAKTHITGTPVKFDPQMTMKQHRGQP
jgi:hypothetical protein